MATKNLPLGTICGTGTLMLPQFAPGMLLQSDDLAALGAYSRELSRLMFRSLFGCGVICGLKVKVGWNCGKIVITIDPGVALDCCGDPIHVTATQSTSIDTECDPKFPAQLYVVLCEKNKCCAPRPAMCASDNGDSTPVCTREKYGFEIRIVADRPTCACGCPVPDAKLLNSDCRCANPESECYKDHYQGVCGCDCCGGGSDCTCDCACVLLALLTQDPQDARDPQREPSWSVDHRVRRFVRPVLIEDPVVRDEEELHKLKLKQKEQKAAAQGHAPEAQAHPTPAAAALAQAAQVHAAQVRTAPAHPAAHPAPAHAPARARGRKNPRR
jgi:hypothetical protein